MASINFPSTVGMLAGTPYVDPISGITYIWSGTYWYAQGPDAAPAIPPSYEELIPIGAVVPFANGVVPDGWLYCDGRSAGILRASYPDLFQALCVAPGFTPQTFTFSGGLFQKTGHGFKGGERLRLFTTGSLMTGVNQGIDYYVIYNSINAFALTAVRGGTAIVLSGSASGTHTYLQSLHGLGDGVSTFNLPDLRDEFIRGAGLVANIGAWQTDMFESHSHTINQQTSTAAGAIYTPIVQSGGNAINTSSVGGSETRPRNLALNYCIKASKLVTNTNLIDVQDTIAPVAQAAIDATWKLHSTITVTPGQQSIAFDPIPTTAKMIRLAIIDLSPASGNAFNMLLQAGASGVYDTTVGHYVGGGGDYNATHVNWVTRPGAVIFKNSAGNADNANGGLELIRVGNTNNWIVSGKLHDSNGNNLHDSTGKVALTSALNKLKLLFDNGGSPDTGFDTGSVALWYL